MRVKTKRLHGPAFLIALLLALMSAFHSPISVQAHPLDMFFFTHEVHLTPDRIEVYTTIQPGPMMALSEWYQLDTDLNGGITPKEIIAWADARMEDFTLSLAGVGELPLTLISVGWPSSAEALQLGDEAFRIAVRAEWPASVDHSSAPHRLELHFQYEETRSINWYYLHGEDGTTFGIPEQDNSRLSVDIRTSADLLSPAAGLWYWDSGSPTLGSADEEGPSGSAADPADNRSSTAILTGLVRTPTLTAAFYLGAILITLTLGAIHALTPGHGKTLAAAYLIGERGTARHAVALGGIVTATHTGSVMIFGLITLVVSQFLIPADFFPYLELLSGLLIVVMAAGLILPRWRGYRRVARARMHIPATESQTGLDRAPGRAGCQSVKRIAVNRTVESRPYDNLLPGGRTTPAAAGGTTRRLLILLGVSGGLVPCPDAVAILLVAVAVNRILLGLALVVTFSLGMAAVLILIGLAVVRSHRWLGRFDLFSRISPILPAVSAVIILGVGLIMTADVVIRYGLPYAERAIAAQTPPPAGAESAFDISQAGILYLARDARGTMQIYLQSPIGQEPRRISNAAAEVADYQLSPDRASIAFASTGKEGSGIWILPIPGGEPQCVVDCRDAYCSNVLWTPDGSHLLYERTEPNSISAVPTLWSYALESGTTQTVFRDPQIPGYTASWSPDGAWLSYFSYPGSPVIEIYNLLTGERDSISSRTGRIASWSPDTASLLVTDMLTSIAQPVSHLFRYDLDTKSLTDLSLRPDVEDYSASWSPNGGWLAVIRRENTASNPTGTQIWLMRPDGGDARPATSIPHVFHSGLEWSPDSRYLLVQQQGLASDSPQPEIWLLDVQTWEYALLVEDGYQPSWGS